VIEAIRDAQEYIGSRVTLDASLAGARISLQIDIGIGDDVTPPPEPCELPVLLDHPAPRLRAYRRETVIAEKAICMDLGGRWAMGSIENWCALSAAEWAGTGPSQQRDRQPRR